MSTSVGRRLIAALAAAAATTGARPALDLLVGDQTRWTRTNHRGEPVSMLEGPAAAVGLLVGGVVGAPTARAALAATVATAGGVAFGLVDDLTEDRATRTKGLRGHLGALAHGELTTGGLKVLGIGVSALAAAAIATRRRSTGGWLFDVATSGALIAASANLVNLLDLRPGRALKAATLAAAPLAITGGPAAGLAAGVIGVCAGAAPGDLAERDMLGDSGANALGALLGTAVVLGSPRSVRLGLLAGAVGLTVASERVSFTKVIATTPVLRELDAWGRRPAPSPGTADPAADLTE